MTITWKLFISYSHEDEWLKNELINHLSALKRNGTIDVWHDRQIPAGGLLHDHIDSQVQTSHAFLFLISNNFIASDYCIHKEYEAAKKRHDAGDAEIIPIIVRPCDWDVGGLRSFNALPPDAIPVTDQATSRADAQQRDKAWLKVVDGIKTVIENLKKKATPPKPNQDFLTHLFEVDSIRHPSLSIFDERHILVDPDIYCETNKEQISTFQRLADLCSTEKAVVITGSDRSGKSVIAKRLHEHFSTDSNPSILINGSRLKNRDLVRVIASARAQQYEPSTFPEKNFRIIIDDFDECALPDQIKEEIIKVSCEQYFSCILISFSSALTVLFASNALPTPIVLLVNQIANAKLYTLVQRWLSIGSNEPLSSDHVILPTFEKIQLVFEQTGLEKSPYTAVTFLQLLDTITASDISSSSFAACYEALIVNRLAQAKFSIGSFDEAKNFLSLVAYRAYSDSGLPIISSEAFADCLSTYETQFLSSPLLLKQMATSLFLKEDGKGYRFVEEYLWFFLTARYVVKFLRERDHSKYAEFVNHCTANIFQRKFANIVIYIAYFSNDQLVIQSLLKTLDSLFSKATDWKISDDTRDLMIGLMNKDKLEIDSKSDVTQNRMQLLQEKIATIIDDAEHVVARYTLPFLTPAIDDSAQSDCEVVIPNAESYMRSVNALLRTHSVIGQILSGRTGTYGAPLVIDCITRMVNASGRYVSLNHAIAAVLMFDRQQSIVEIDRAIDGDQLTPEQKYEKVTKIFAFWSVYISHVGLARYLQDEHSIRALDILTNRHEGDDAKTPSGNIPFNFTLVKLVAELYNSGKINRHAIESCIQKYGTHSALISFLRVVIHMYAYYMPLTIEDKQWASNKLRIPMTRLEVQHLKYIASGSDKLRPKKSQGTS